MYYVRNSAGGMLAVTPKSSTVVAVKKQVATKPAKKIVKKSKAIQK